MKRLRCVARPCVAKRCSPSQRGTAEFAKSMDGFGVSKPIRWRDGPVRKASAVLITPAAPAAAVKWPMLLLIDPIAQCCAVCQQATMVRTYGVGAGECQRQRLHLDRIAQWRCRAMRFHVGDLVRRHACIGMGHRDHFGLPAHAGCGEAGLVAAVVVQRGALIVA
jgi:hypothetical protein